MRMECVVCQIYEKQIWKANDYDDDDDNDDDGQEKSRSFQQISTSVGKKTRK